MLFESKMFIGHKEDLVLSKQGRFVQIGLLRVHSLQGVAIPSETTFSALL